jgi:hypothetical protein
MRDVYRKDWTDEAVVIGPDRRWVQDDYEDLNRAYPEVLLGLRVRLMTIDMVRRGSLMGRAPVKIVVFDGCQRERGWRDAWHQLLPLKYIRGTRIEFWYVHRGIGVWKMDLTGAYPPV